MSSRSEDAVEIVDGPVVWAHDGAGYPDLADLPPSPEPLPESVRPPEDLAQPPAAGKAPDHPAGAAAARKTAGGLAFFRDEFGEHLDELRRRLLISLAVFLPFFLLGLVLYRELWALVILPLERAAPHLLRFQALNPSDGLIMAMRVALAFAFFLSLPVWLSQLWRFAAPGLTKREIRWLHLSLGVGGALFALGVAAAYFGGVPLALAYLLPFNQTLDGWENAFTGSGYVDFVISCCCGFGLAFELPLLMLALGWVGILTPAALRRGWRAAVLGIFILSAVLTPPDPFTQILLALPLLILFGLGYWLVAWSAGRSGRD